MRRIRSIRLAGSAHRRATLWTLRIGLVLGVLGTAEDHHTTESTIGTGFLVLSIVISFVPQGQRLLRRAWHGDEEE